MYVFIITHTYNIMIMPNGESGRGNIHLRHYWTDSIRALVVSMMQDQSGDVLNLLVLLSLALE